jgi:pimeloyl-ACP methyl ester carboxylesterase
MNRVHHKHYRSKRCVALTLTRRYTHDADAKVILVVHSMGGLVARHYLEVLDGWRDCLALLSFGTPYRGSLNSLNFLVNGYKKANLDLSDCMRSFSSMYQLLPTYPVIERAGKFCNAQQVSDLPGISARMSQSAAGFHEEIAASFNRDLDRRLAVFSLTSAEHQQVDRERPRLAAAETSDRRVSIAVAESFVHGYRVVIWIAVGLALASAISASAFLSTTEQAHR